MVEKMEVLKNEDCFESIYRRIDASMYNLTYGDEKEVYKPLVKQLKETREKVRDAQFTFRKLLELKNGIEVEIQGPLVKHNIEVTLNMTMSLMKEIGSIAGDLALKINEILNSVSTELGVALSLYKKIRNKRVDIL